MRTFFTAACCLLFGAAQITAAQTFLPIVPLAKRGTSDAERVGVHDANNIRTRFWNYGMVGDYPNDPIGVDLATFHSAEVPKGSGMNYTDGITPFVLAKITQTNASTAYIMETGYREGQGTSVKFNRRMRFEPRPDYFEKDPSINIGRSSAISNDPRTWPKTWPEKDTSYNGRWNGYFGTSLAFAPDQESFTVMDDQYYDAWDFQPDSRDNTRYGLGLKIEVRGFQWATPQAGNVIFYHYDITNEGTTSYPAAGSTDENIIFGVYMDSGVGGSSIGADPVPESDDDNAAFDRSSGLNLVYTWDNYGRGKDLLSSASKTGYLGYAYLETPGKPFDAVDNDQDGITNESRDTIPGTQIVGQANIRAYVQANYNLTQFEGIFGKLENRLAYKTGVWWTGDEDLDWVASLNDFGEDGEPDTHDRGEGDGKPTPGEQNFGRTDLHESDQIGLTGFRMWRIGPSSGGEQDFGIAFYKNPNAGKPVIANNYSGDYPKFFYDYFTNSNPASRFDQSSANNGNIGFLFASGPFTLKAAGQERFSLALAFGYDLLELKNTVKVVQTIYNGNYKFATPPPTPTLIADAGDGFVQLHWNDVAERSTDPTTGVNDFEGYKIYRATDYNFNDVTTVVSARGISVKNNGNPLAQYDLKNNVSGFSSTVVNGQAYFLGTESGLTHSFRDTTVVNGQEYYYAVTSYDFGATIIQGASSEAFTFYPAENSMSVTRSLLGGTILPKNVVVVRPNPKVPGFKNASTSGITKLSGNGTGTVAVRVLNSALVPNNHMMKITFNTNPDSVHPLSYNLVDSTASNSILFNTGIDFAGLGTGISEAGILPVISTIPTYQIDTSTTGFRGSSKTKIKLDVRYVGSWPVNYKRLYYPSNLRIRFSNTIIDTALAPNPLFGDPLPVKFTVVTPTDSGEQKVPFTFFDSNGDSTLSYSSNPDEIKVLTGPATATQSQRITWSIRINAAGVDTGTVMPTLGDTYTLNFFVPFSANDVFVFNTSSQLVQAAAAKEAFKDGPYVVPNPYVGAASFEPAPFGVQGRGDRRMEFRNLPLNSTVRIYTVRGELVRTLTQDGSTTGVIPWDLRTKDNLDVAPGLYIFQVDAGTTGSSIGKFAIIK
jgi:hypothetical protein